MEATIWFLSLCGISWNFRPVLFLQSTYFLFYLLHAKKLFSIRSKAMIHASNYRLPFGNFMSLSSTTKMLARNSAVPYLWQEYKSSQFYHFQAYSHGGPCSVHMQVSWIVCEATILKLALSRALNTIWGGLLIQQVKVSPWRFISKFSFQVIPSPQSTSLMESCVKSLW